MPDYLKLAREKCAELEERLARIVAERDRLEEEGTAVEEELDRWRDWLAEGERLIRGEPPLASSEPGESAHKPEKNGIAHSAQPTPKVTAGTLAAQIVAVFRSRKAGDGLSIADVYDTLMRENPDRARTFRIQVGTALKRRPDLFVRKGDRYRLIDKQIVVEDTTKEET